MIQVTPKHHIYVGIAAIDFRKGIDGIASLCQHQLGNDAKNGHVFIFRNKKATAIKVLVYDGQGFWLCHKRLSTGSFKHWPSSAHQVIQLDVAQLQVLLYNGDVSQVHTQLPWRSVV